MATRDSADRRGGFYEIRVRGHLAGCWSEWFEGFSVRNVGLDVAVISGEARDQAALHGALARVRDLNLTLLSVRRLPADVADVPGSER